MGQLNIVFGAWSVSIRQTRFELNQDVAWPNQRLNRVKWTVENRSLYFALRIVDGSKVGRNVLQQSREAFFGHYTVGKRAR